MKNLMVYFVDSKMYLFDKKERYCEVLNDIISKGMIIDKTKFLEKFNSILKKYKIKNKMFGDKITVVKNVYYTYSDLFLLENVFLDLGFTKVEFFDIREVLPDDNDVTYIEVNQDYIVFYLLDGLMLSTKYYNDIPKLFTLFDIHFCNTLVFFGTYHDIPSILYAKKDTFYFENYQTYLIDCLLKVKKCDV